MDLRASVETTRFATHLHSTVRRRRREDRSDAVAGRQAMCARPIAPRRPFEHAQAILADDRVEHAHSPVRCRSDQQALVPAERGHAAGHRRVRKDRLNLASIVDCGGQQRCVSGPSHPQRCAERRSRCRRRRMSDRARWRWRRSGSRDRRWATATALLATVGAVQSPGRFSAAQSGHDAPASRAARVGRARLVARRSASAERDRGRRMRRAGQSISAALVRATHQLPTHLQNIEIAVVQMR